MRSIKGRGGNGHSFWIAALRGITGTKHLAAFSTSKYLRCKDPKSQSHKVAQGFLYFPFLEPPKVAVAMKNT